MRTSQRITSGLIVGVVALTLSFSASAQQGGRGRGGGPVPQRLLAKLNLNADQEAKIKAANDALMAEMEKIKTLSTPQEKRQATTKARADYKTAVEAVLNADQQKQLQT